MRALALLAVLALLPTVAAGPGTGTTVDPEVSVSPDGCDDCASASLWVSQVVPNCFDCPGLLLYASAEHDGQQTTVEYRACRTGFPTVCLVERPVTIG